MRGLVCIVGLLAVTVAACDRPIPVALNTPPPYVAPPAYAAQYPAPPTPYAAQYPPPQYGVSQSPPPPAPPQAQSVALSNPPAQMILTNKSDEPTATVQLDTLQVGADGKGSATVCHKSERGGQVCNLWSFDCNYLADKQFAHSNYFPSFMQQQNGPVLTAEQSAELDALDTIATKLPPEACRHFGHEAKTSQWQEVRDGTGNVKATIEVATIMRDADGNSHARVCLNTKDNSTCPNSKVVLRWYINCRTHQYSWLDTSVMPGVPREMNDAQPNSVADKVATIACK